MFSYEATSQATTGKYNRVPNGSFEALAVGPTPEGAVGLPENTMWNLTYLRYSLYWRQFARDYIDRYATNDFYQLPIQADRLYGNRLQPYKPTSCASPDLFSKGLTECIPNSGEGYSPVAIPLNLFGFRTLNPDNVRNQRYAGLHYRWQAADGDPNNPPTKFWREYLQVELLTPLDVGKMYTFRAKVAVADATRYVPIISARVSPEPYSIPGDDCAHSLDGGPNAVTEVPVTTAGNLQIASVQLANRTPQWVDIVTTFVANGNEKYLTLGDFRQASQGGIVPGPVPDRDCGAYPAYLSDFVSVAYLYVDDVRIEEDIECVCNADVCVEIKPVATSSNNGQCCYNVYIINGHRRGNGTPVQPQCDITQLRLYSEDNNNLLFTWVAATPAQGIAPDNTYYKVGELCLPEFPRSSVRTIRAVTGSAGNAALCEEAVPIVGCADALCLCDPEGPFEPLRLERVVTSNGEDCCWDVVGNLANIPCDAVEARFFATRRSALIGLHVDDEVPGTRTTLLSAYAEDPSRSTVLARICNVTNDADGLVRLSIGYYNASGELLCNHAVDAVRGYSCECDCGISGYAGMHPKIELVKKSETINGCCYDVHLKGGNECLAKVSDVSLKGQSSVHGEVASSGFTVTSTSSNGVTTVSYSASPPVNVVGSTDVIVGSVCIDACDPSVSPGFNGIVSMAGTPTCTVSVNSVAQEKCSTEVSCENLTVIYRTLPKTGYVGEDCDCVFEILLSADFCLLSSDIDFQVSTGLQTVRGGRMMELPRSAGPVPGREYYVIRLFKQPPGTNYMYHVRVVEKPSGEVLCESPPVQFTCPLNPLCTPQALTPTPDGLNRPNNNTGDPR